MISQMKSKLTLSTVCTCLPFVIVNNVHVIAKSINVYQKIHESLHTLHKSLLFDLCWITEVKSVRKGRFHDFKSTVDMLTCRCVCCMQFNMKTFSLISGLIVMTFERHAQSSFLK